MTGKRQARGVAFGAVLAGGASRRMGRPKALVELAGRPLISYALAAVEAAGLDPIVIAKPSSSLPELSCPLAREPEQPNHPLCGILAALRASNGRPVIAVACDMPFVSAPLLAWLASLEVPVAVCKTDAGLHPLLARYEPSLIDALAGALERGDSMRKAIHALHPRVVGEPDLRRFGNPKRLTFNVNEQSDLAVAEQLAAQGSQEP